MLSATLTGFFAGQVPTSIPPGVSDHVTVRVSDPSGQVETGKVSVSLYLSPTPALGSEALILGTATRNVRLRNGQSAAFPFRFASPSALPDGTDYLLARIDAPANGSVSETIVVAPQTVSIARPFVDLVGQIAQQPSELFVNSSCPTEGQARIQVFNTGNVAARGALQITTYASTDATLDSSDTVISVANFPGASIRPGGSRVFPARLSFPAGMPVGNYVILASINSSHVIAETNLANNLAIGPHPLALVSAPAGNDRHSQQNNCDQISVEIDTGSNDAGFVPVDDSNSYDTTPTPDDGSPDAPAPPDSTPVPPDSATSQPDSTPDNSSSSADPGAGGDFSGPSPDDPNAGTDF